MGDGEFDLIKSLRESLSLRRLDAAHGLVEGVGDDAAVLRQTSELDTVITTDLLVEGIDFTLTGDEKTDASVIGRRAVAVSLSDIAAMGARPRWLLLSVGVPRKLWERGFARALLSNAMTYASDIGVTLVGGDISRTLEHVVVDSIVLGEVERGRAVLRSGARVGDQIFVTGSLGGASAGLKILEGGRVRQSHSGARMTSATRGLVARQLQPTPRVEWGALLGERRLASAMIDLSDGLSSDIMHICRESRAGARIEAASLPLDPLLESAGITGDDALSLALHGGEDFELLFTVSERDARGLPSQLDGVQATRIGEVTRERGKVRLVRDGRARLLRPGGFDHFGRTRR
jgi:thiamine-monophosphate kinase